MDPSSPRSGNPSLGSLSPGVVLARKYRIDRVLGRGGMAVVFAATHLQLREPVAIKVLQRQILARPGAFERFLREARVAMRLRSEHVARVHDIGSADDGAPFIVMELLRGSDLATYLAERGPLDVSEAVDYVLQACQALVEAHASGVVHRDLKPANLFLCPNIDGFPCVKVLDFGVSKLLHDDALAPDPFGATAPPSGELPDVPSDEPVPTPPQRREIAESAPGGVTLTRAFLGSPQYMAPEQIRSARDVDARADVWALGVILYELVSGGRPFQGETVTQLCDCILERHAAPLLLPGGPSPELEAALAGCFAKDPAERYQNVRTFAEAIVRFGSAAGKGTFERIYRMTEPSVATRPASARPLGVDPTLDSGENRPSSAASGAVRRLARRDVFVVAVAAAVGLTGGGLLLRARLFGPVQRSPAASSAESSHSPSRARCASNTACTTEHGGAASRCREDGACVTLGSEECVVLADRTALDSADTIWFGAMLPRDDRSEADADLNAIKLAREDFAEMMSGFGRQGGDTRVRPFGVVGCDDTKDAMRAAKHLVEDVQVPAIIGFASAEEAVDIGGALLVPNQIVGVGSISTSPLVTRLPNRPGQPRLMWRTTYSFAEVVKAVARVVPDLFEPEIRATPGFPSTTPGNPIRVAFLRSKMRAGPTADTLLFRALTFNGKSALENGPSFREIVLDDSDPAKLDANTKDVVAELDRFAPQVIIYGATQPARVIEPLEAGWSHGPRPRYLWWTAVPRELFAWVGKSAERRGRLFGLEPVSTTSVNARFVMHYNENAATKVSLTFAPNTSYDAFYLLAYASYALGEEPVTGPNLSRAIARLVPPGRPVDVGPEGIFEAYSTLRRGENIDLNGATGSLDFDLATGEAPFDHAVLCIGVDRAGAASESVESGVVFRSAMNRLEGTPRCP
jgi:serine/threonine protein kinase/ABC-type branched-subunit amino acid transport system substrate-binding protein